MDLELIGKIFAVLFDQGVMGAMTGLSILFAWYKDKQATALNAKVIELLLTVTQTIQINKEETDQDDRNKLENARANLLDGGSDDSEDPPSEPKVSDSQKIRRFSRGPR